MAQKDWEPKQPYRQIQWETGQIMPDYHGHERRIQSLPAHVTFYTFRYLPLHTHDFHVGIPLCPCSSPAVI